MRIARELIDPDAEKVVRRLSRHGYQAYLVGGCVRDLLLGRTPKDFDVATSATPKEIKQLFRNCRIIGRRFRLAHIFFGGKVIETSTFRTNPRKNVDDGGELLIRRDNVFGTDTEDAQRRDFTINGLFYDVEAEKVIDHVGGQADLSSRIVSTIGNPDIRFQEDPVRMLRAIKFAARLGFSIAEDSYSAVIRRRGDIAKCAQPRVLEELYRLLRGGAARRSIELLVETGIAGALSPQLANMFGGPNDPTDSADAPTQKTDVGAARGLAWSVLDQFDRLFATDRELSNALIIASICGPFVVSKLLSPDLRPLQANEVVESCLLPLSRQLQLARRDAERARQILLAQRRLSPARRRRGKPMSLVRRDYFAESLAVYELLGLAQGRDVSDMEYWHRLQAQGAQADGQRTPGKRRRRRRGGRRRHRATASREHQDTERDPERCTPKTRADSTR